MRAKRGGQVDRLNRNCIKCDVLLVEGENWYPWAKKDHRYQCKECIRQHQRSRQYRQNINKRRQYVGIRIEILKLLGERCAKCGFPDNRALQIDHTNGGGCQERKTFGTNMREYYKSVLEKIKNGDQSYQCLCANCNCIQRDRAGRTNGKSSAS